METTNTEPKTDVPVEATPVVAAEAKPAAAKKEEVKEEYKDFGEYEARIVPVQVERKVIPIASYGHRIRIASLWDQHEEYLYKIIQVAGWAKTVRTGGKDFAFIEVTDGSSHKSLQVSTNLINICKGCDHQRG
jgi:hypothetical protein